MPNTNTELEYFSVRDVSQKQIYDSYMGILRISPNKINNKDVDDPTTILNTLVDVNGYLQEGDGKNTQVKVFLSDSDGNVLPIWFIPKAYTTQILINNGFKDKKDIINICTKIDDGGLTFVSNSLTNRSTLLLSKPQGKKSQLTFVLGCKKTSASQTVECKSILLYPIEAPNDDDFFNNKNKYWLFDPKDNTPRHQQMETNLLNKSAQWYTDKGLWYDANSNKTQHQVVVNGKAITHTNDYNEQIPLLHTRDYVLGVYDGHSYSKDVANENAFAEHSKDVQGTSNVRLTNDSQTRTLTKLSWLRFDNLIWQALDEILKGKVRHTNGRYNGLGKNQNNDICQALFGQNVNTIMPQLKRNAPILGQQHQCGLVSYHAMPFHKYWFHRCRQVAHNMNYWATQNKEANWKSYPQCYDKQIETLQAAVNAKKLTAAADATTAPHQSLAKNFVLCDGKKINFVNYPNISLRNDKLFNITTRGLKISGREFTNKEAGGWLIHSKIKTTPELYVFDEKFPRFIRGLNWKSSQNDWETSMDDTTYATVDMNAAIGSNQYSVIDANNPTVYIHTHDYKKKDGKYDTTFNKDVFNKNGIDIKKDLSSLGNPNKVSKATWEYLTQVRPHHHKLFSMTAGGSSCDTNGVEVLFYQAPGGGHVKYIEKCLWYDHKSTNITRDKEWVNYCLQNSNVYFDCFTPVPNLGLFIFNGNHYNTFYNNYYNGTISDYENRWGSYNFGYIDGNNDWVAINNDNSYPSEIRSPEQAATHSLLLNHQIHKFKRKQLSVKLNQSQARIPISFSGKAGFKIKSYHQGYWYKKPKKWKKWVAAIAGGLVAIVTGGVFGALGIDIGWKLGAITTALLWPHGKGWKAGSKSYTHRNNIGRYTIGTIEHSKILGSLTLDANQAVDDTYSYHCVTSLPFTCTEKLAVGLQKSIKTFTDLTSYIDKTLEDGDDYYVAHNVTDRWSVYKDTSGKTNYRQNQILTDNFDGEECVYSEFKDPYPSHMNLIPILRI